MSDPLDEDELRRRYPPGSLGVTIYRGEAMKEPCPECPFVEGTPLNRTLPPERLDDFKFKVTIGQPFWCHKTCLTNPKTKWDTDPETGEERHRDFDRHYKMCAGAVLWAEKFKAELEGKGQDDDDASGD